jgi:DNA-binding CsgD family transcriptional regulator
VEALDNDELGRMVHEHLGLTLPRPLLVEVHEASGGNPFYALEIVRMLQRAGFSIEAGRPLPVPDSLHDLVDKRLAALPDESGQFLLAAAAHAHPTVSITEAASGVGADRGLAPALNAGIVELDGERIRFTHPLLAAVVIERADRSQRAVVHARLAELLEDPEARAWQLAAATARPDESVASLLEAAAHHAQARGATRPAALLLDRAGELTPADRVTDATRRAVDAAFLHFESGDSPPAEAQLRTMLDASVPGEQRSRALWMLARIRTYEAPGEAVDLFLRLVAEAEAQGDPELLAISHEGAASSLLWLLERFEEQIAHADAALAFALDAGDDALAGDALLSKLLAEAWLGKQSAAATAATALALQDSTADRRLLDQPVTALAQFWMWADDIDRARSLLVELVRRVNELGDESSRPYVLSLLGQLEFLLGHVGEARQCAREGQDAASQSGQPLYVAYHLALEGLVEGRPELAREALVRARALIPGLGGEGGLLGLSALAQLELALGNPKEVTTCLKPALAHLLREGIAEPNAIRLVADQIEAFVELGRVVDAEQLLDWYEGNARRLERVSALANCARCRGMLAAQARDLDTALAAYTEALELHAHVELPLDRGRTLLALGATQRRLKRRREARETLEEALGVFERIGAAFWAERTRAELARISGRASTPGALTPAEERVAALVAEGKTNREVAAALFLSDRTVEGHLSRVFGKLGIKHRTEVAPALAARQAQGTPVPNTEGASS